MLTRQRQFSPPKFPLGLCVVTVLVTGGALMLATHGIYWGAASRPDAVDLSAKYVTQSFLAILFMFWPAMRLRFSLRPSAIFLDAAAMLISAAPAMMFAFWLSLVTWQGICGYLLLIALWLMIISLWLIIMLAAKTASLRVFGQVLLCIWYAGGVLLLYLHAEFFPAAPTWWRWLVPAYGLL